MLYQVEGPVIDEKDTWGTRHADQFAAPSEASMTAGDPGPLLPLRASAEVERSAAP